MGIKWTWDDLKDQWVKFLQDSFDGEVDNMLGDLYDIALPIVEEITHMDLNDDGITDHMKSEIWAIVEDKGIEWGDDITEALIAAAQGNLLKQLFAAAQIASWASQLSIFAGIPLSSWLVNLIIDWVIKGIKASLDIADAKFNDLIKERMVEYQAAVSRLIPDLETATGKDISTEHFWGTDKLIIFAGDKEDSSVYHSSLRGLMAVQKSPVKYVDYIQHWKDKIG